MHTPEGTLERTTQQQTTSIIHAKQPSADGAVLSHVITTPNMLEDLKSSVLGLQNQINNFTLHKSTSEPAMVVTTNHPPVVCQDSSPDTPQPAYDLNKGWINGFFACLRPVMAMIGKGAVNEIKNCQDEWEIPFEHITGLEYIGSGSQGTVFSGMLYNQSVAVKKVLDFKSTDIKNLRKLNHPNIIKFKGVCIQAPCFCIVMEFCPYGPLCNLLKNQKNVVTTNRVVSWAKQITSGMHYLHTQKIIHRDLKSPNVLIGEEEVIKISDFGTSKTWSGVSEKMSFAGTVAWMAPEVIQELECSEKVDVWSFGIVLWELLTCEVPYDGMEQSAIMYLVGSGKLKPPIPKTCPEGFKLIMEMCWKMNPKERPAFKLIQNHLQIAAVEILGKYEDTQFFKTQASWKEEIKSQITQFKAQMQKHRIEYQLKEEMLIKKREIEIKHIRDIRELYDRKLEKVQQLYLELSGVLQQVEQYRQGGRKREITNKRRLINPFMTRKFISNNNNNNNNCNNRRNGQQSTTPTSPECSLTSPDSPNKPVKTYAELNQTNDSIITTTIIQNNNHKFRKRHHRTNSGSPRNSRILGSSSRNSTVVDTGTQTDSMDLSETDLGPSTVTSPNSTSNKRLQRVILQEIHNSSDNDDDDVDDNIDGNNSNGNTIQLHYMAQRENLDLTTQVFTTTNYNHNDDRLNSNDDDLNHHHDNHDYSDEDNLETIERKVSALKNGNIFTDIRISTENGNVTEEIGEVIRQKCSETRNGQDSTEDACNDSFTDEEDEIYKNPLRRRSLARRPIYPNRRSARYKYSLRGNHQREINNSDGGDTSEYSISPSSKSSTLESNHDRTITTTTTTLTTTIIQNQSMKRPNQHSEGSSDSESEENLTIVPYNINNQREESVA